MTTPEEEYRRLRPNYEIFCERLANLIEMLLREAGIKVHAIERRAKEVESFQQKLQKPEKYYTDPLRQITDLCGIRVIAYYLDDLERIGKLLEQEFDLDKLNSSDRGALLKPNEFGYHSHHYVVKLSHVRSELSEWRALSNICAEIQVRTVLQHAWAAISHALQYKAKANVPAELSRKLYRVSGLLELADEEFTEISNLNKNISRSVAISINEGNLSIDINRTSIIQYIDKSEEAKTITQLAIKAGFRLWTESDIEENEYDPISEITWACKRAGLKTISELDDLTKRNQSLLSTYFHKLIISAEAKDLDNWGGPSPWFIALTVFLFKIECFDQPTLVTHGWNDALAKIVINAAQGVTKEAHPKQRNKRGE